MVRNWFNEGSKKGLRIMSIDQLMDDTCMTDNPWLKNIRCSLRSMDINQIKISILNKFYLQKYSNSIVESVEAYVSKYDQQILIISAQYIFNAIVNTSLL